MEPNILASHDASDGGRDPIARPDDSLTALAADSRLVVEDGVARTAESATGGVAHRANGAPEAWTPGLTSSNGHANRRSNGHSAWGTLALESLAGTTYSPALPAASGVRRSLYLRCGKRALDVAGALIGLVLTAPLLAAAALLVLLESRGPVLYKSRRVGRGGKPFTFYKLRSMVNGADRHRDQLSHLNETDGPVFKIARDPRVTRVGRFLRTTSIDELPQLINVLRGDMSLVGPRPPIAEEVALYEPWQLRRLEVRPGLTCLWQISGRSRIGFQEWMRLDLEYIRQQSFWLDVGILIRTIPAVLSREGAY